MATLALPRASVTAMARPIPREPPVTRALFPVKSNMLAPLQYRERLVERGRIFDVQHLDALVDALHQPRKHPSWAYFDHPRHAEADELLHALDPADRGGHLLEE